jgi:hypothetical protein
MASPLAIVKDKFGDKDKLVAAIEKLADGDLWLGRTNERKGLAHVSNAKLLRLHRIFSAVKEKFGTRAKLIDAILELEKRTKDDGFRARLEKHPVPRLFDEYGAAAKRAHASEPKKPRDKTAEKKAPKAAAKPAAKKPAAKKASAAKKKA